MGDANSIPAEHRRYWGLIRACPLPKEEMGKVGYLSISESFVPKGQTQRRPGLHTERTDLTSWGGWGGGGTDEPRPTPNPRPYPNPMPPDNTIGAGRGAGLFMASTIAGSCRLWNWHVRQPGIHGDCEHLRPTLEACSAYEPAANELVWLTDSCPHEALPAVQSAFRQWFRLVSSNVGKWWSKHSTPNPLGIMPACEIVHSDKF